MPVEQTPRRGVCSTQHADGLVVREGKEWTSKGWAIPK